MLLLVASLAQAECVTADRAAVQAQVTAAMDREDVPGAIGVLQAAWNQLPSACAPPAPGDLGWMAYTAAALALEANQGAEAERWTDVALTAVPSEVPAEALGPKVRILAATRKVEIDARPKERVCLEQVVVLDGRNLAPADEGALLTTGSHLVMWQESGAWRGTWFSLEEGLPQWLPAVQRVEGGTCATTSVATTVEKKRSALPAVLVGTGAAVAAGGVAWLVLGAMLPYNANCTYDSGSGLGGLAACDEQHGLGTDVGYIGGIALIGAGAGLGLTGLRVAVLPAAGGVVVNGRF